MTTGKSIKEWIITCDIRKSRYPMELTTGNGMDTRIMYYLYEGLLNLGYYQGNRFIHCGVKRNFKEMRNQLYTIFGGMYEIGDWQKFKI